METLLADFGREEDQRLAAAMPPRGIGLCEDETFHPQICLVAIEPVSNFLLLEQQRHQQATEARHHLSRTYHPVDLETGRPREAEEVGALRKQDLDQVDEIAAAAGLSAAARQKLSKARRALPAMLGTILFFWMTVTARLASWQLSPAVTVWMREELILGSRPQPLPARAYQCHRKA